MVVTGVTAPDVALAPFIACCAASVVQTLFDKVSRPAAVRFGGLAIPFLAGAAAAQAYGHPRVAYWVGYLALGYAFAAAFLTQTRLSNDEHRQAILRYCIAVMLAAVVYSVVAVKVSTCAALFVPAAVVLVYIAFMQPHMARMVGA